MSNENNKNARVPKKVNMRVPRNWIIPYLKPMVQEDGQPVFSNAGTPIMSCKLPFLTVPITCRHDLKIFEKEGTITVFIEYQATNKVFKADVLPPYDKKGPDEAPWANGDGTSTMDNVPF